MNQPKRITRCASCEGYGWFEEAEIDATETCEWCAGAGYVYHEAGRDRVIPKADYAAIADELEALELERLRELGYQGLAKKPWQQQVRKDTQLGRNPYCNVADD